MVIFPGSAPKKLGDEYAADRIINRLEPLHPNFYPYPVIMTVTSGGFGSPGHVHLDDRKEAYLTKEDLSRLYHRSGEFLHRGTAKKLLSSKSPRQMQFAGKDFSEIATWTRKIIVLLEAHKISSIDNRRHLLVVLADATKGDGVSVAYAESPKPR